MTQDTMEERFLLHVRSTCLHKESFTSLYYTVGIAEECAEFYQEMMKAEVDQKRAIVEVGGSSGEKNVIWFLI